mgnify:FL=1
MDILIPIPCPCGAKVPLNARTASVGTVARCPRCGTQMQMSDDSAQRIQRSLADLVRSVNDALRR